MASPTAIWTGLAQLLVLSAVGCGGDSKPASDAGTADASELDAASDTWDIDRDDFPALVAVDYIDVTALERISRFRSGVGHDYSDDYEDCRSMKHYFQPKAELDWSTLAIHAPVSGTVSQIEEEAEGTRVEIQVASHPAFRIVLFHVVLSAPLSLGDEVSSGQQLGHHVGNQTFSDIAVAVTDQSFQRRLLSYFDLTTDDVFAAYQVRGVATREELTITQEERDLDPLVCDGELFATPGGLDNWIELD